MSSYGSPGGGGYGPMGGMPGGPGGFGPPMGGAPPPADVPPRTDTLAIVALVGGLLALAGAIANLVTGIFGMCCPLCTIGGAVIGAIVAVPAITGIACGAISYKRTTTEGGEPLTGKGLALTGAITGGLAMVMTVVTVVGPWLGLGCMAATAPPPPPDGTTTSPWDPQPVGPTQVDPNVAPTNPTIAPTDPTVAPTDPAPADPNAPAADPSAAGTACSRVEACCRAYIEAMGTGAPASSCDVYQNVAAMPETTCANTIAGYRSGLSALGRAIPAACN